MGAVFEVGMAVCLDAAMAALILHFIRQKTEGTLVEKLISITMVFGFAIGMAVEQAHHARAALVLCGIGVLLSYVAEGFAFAGEVHSHE